MTLQEDYQISIESFRGPLDLLLYLIRRAEVDIHDIPIAQITDQYFQFLRQLDEVDIDTAGEFLVMAATLVEIKSRTLAPPAKDGEAADENAIGLTDVTGVESTDPRYELIQQLLAYQKYRIASDELEKQRIVFSKRFPRWPAKWDLTKPQATDDSNSEFEDSFRLEELELEDAHVLDLTEAYERIMASIDFGKLGDHKVEIDDTPIALHQEDLLDRLSRCESHRLTLQDAFEGANTSQRVGLFMATLELVRLRRVAVTQPEIESPIELTLNEDASEALVIETDEIAHYGEHPPPA
jgi:segregation and condensation protein A